MVNVWDISAGDDKCKVSIRPAIIRVAKCAVIIAPALLLSSVAFAEEVPNAVNTAKEVKKMAKAQKAVDKFNKAAAVAVTGQVCNEAGKSIIKQGTTAGSPKLALATAFFSAVCAVMVTLHVLQED